MIAVMADETSQINKIASRCSQTMRSSDRGFICAGATGIFNVGVAINSRVGNILLPLDTSLAPHEPNRLALELLEPHLDRQGFWLRRIVRCGIKFKGFAPAKT